MNWLFGAYSLWMDNLPSLDTGGEGLGPASIEVKDFVDSTWEASPSLRSSCGEQVNRRERELGLICNI